MRRRQSSPLTRSSNKKSSPDHPHSSIRFLFSGILILYLLFVSSISLQFQGFSLHISPGSIIAAAETVSSGNTSSSEFQIFLNRPGVTLYRRNYPAGSPDYVTIVDLKAATVCNLTGFVNGEHIDRQTLNSFWQEAASQNAGSYQLQVVINGAFFGIESGGNTAGIAFGLKSGGHLITYGYGLNEYPGLNKTFAFDAAAAIAQIQPYQSTTFDASTPDVIGALAAVADKSPSRRLGRTFVGVMNSHSDSVLTVAPYSLSDSPSDTLSDTVPDTVSNTIPDTVLFFSSAASTQAHAEAVLKRFGATAVAMLDGGGSTGLIADGTAYISTDRAVPHAIAIYTGKPDSAPFLLPPLQDFRN
ncbi:hypothetical protein IFO70_17940 [Phormidium tenue FACHB-886]|nr:hypothetical protein [Phormidium tenue FACHB-886]